MNLDDFYTIEVDEAGTPYSYLQQKFKDILKICSKNIEFCGYNLYPHQFDSLNYLLKGEDIILRAETGSGKTEVWVSYALEKDSTVLVVYPTKALTNDQLYRIAKYYKQAGYSVDVVENTRGNEKRIEIYGDVVRYDGDTSKKVRDYVSNAKVVLTNPEMLLLGLKGRNALSSFLSGVDLIVVDELDFYRSSKSTVLLFLIKKVLERSSRDPRIIIMSATLNNVNSIMTFFKDRKFHIIQGKAYRPKNKTYIVLGKGIKFNSIDEILKNSFLAQEILRLNRDYSDEIIKRAKSSGSTIVFVPTTNMAENLSGKTDVPSHHSRVSRRNREEIERKLRDGELNAVITVKTLQQGIDVGTITRIIHVGLPNNLSDFRQREGRKGRRIDIKETESIIIPISWDDLVRAKYFQVWKSMENESLIINSDNKIIDEYDECIKSPDIECKFYDVYNNITAYIYDGNEFRQSSDKFSWRVYVETKIKGTIDRQNRSLTFESGKIIGDNTQILETQVEFDSAKFLGKEVQFPECLKEAIYSYDQVVKRWGQKGDFFKDIAYGKVYSMVSLNVIIPEKGGYVQVTEFPKDVVWEIESRERVSKVKLSDGTEIPTYEYSDISLSDYCRLPKPKYNFKTYAYVSEIQPSDMKEGDLAMDFILALLRKNYFIELNAIKYDISNNLLKIWESEPIALLKHLREDKKTLVGDKELTCTELMNDVENATIDFQLKLILDMINPKDLINIQKNFESIKNLAKRYVYYICDAVLIKEKLVPSSLPENTAIIDYQFGKYYVATKESEKMLLKLDEVKNELFNLALKNYQKFILYGINKSEFGALKEFSVDVDELVKKIFDSPITLSKVEENLLGTTKILEKEIEINNKLNENKEVTNEDYEQLFKLRARMIAALYNYIEKMQDKSINDNSI
ncbi:DEAD/DEAH box helicase [Acidianus manzaensis]|uniref:DEAD/DEAH box helicase n=1 Tax=Acidianus manzaensis TaxID=282676 RepID=A0A1W6JWG1_9CREN|nr:DEAD/DEAH box helicase [Acidianus manzaensis]ARM74603.1 hypothetical protein B6F84_00205 [Acidianus manzaensis]